PGQKRPEDCAPPAAVLVLGKGREFPADVAVVDPEAVGVGAEDREVHVHDQARVVALGNRVVPRREDQLAHPGPRVDRHATGREGLIRNGGARRLIVGAAGLVDHVMEPDRDLDLVGLLGVTARTVEMLEAFGYVREHVIVTPRLGIARGEVAIHRRRPGGGAEAAPERVEPARGQKLNPSSMYTAVISPPSARVTLSSPVGWSRPREKPPPNALCHSSESSPSAQTRPASARPCTPKLNGSRMFTGKSESRSSAPPHAAASPAKRFSSKPR